MFNDPLRQYYNHPLDRDTARMMLKSRRIKLIDIAPFIGYTPNYISDVLAGRKAMSDHVRVFILRYVDLFDQKLGEKVVKKQ